MEEQEWKHCSKWLIRCSILPQDHKVTSAKATVSDLAGFLRDGVLLCLLLNKLCPGAIDKNDISQRTQMSQFLCLKNIRTFLQTCENRFGLRPENLFNPYQLYELTDFAKVIATLSKLSKAPLALKTITPGFPPDSFRSAGKYDDEEIYMHLEHFANENCIEDNQLEDVYDVVNAEDPEEIYEEMCKTSRPKKSPGESLSVFSPVTKRDFCAQELLETEKNYVDALNMIHKNFFQPLRGFVPKEDRDKIFMNIEDLRSLHIFFLDDLQKNYPDHISGCFKRHRDKFLSYGHYCSLLTKAQDHIQSITSKNEQIKSKILECEKLAKDGKFRLRDILSVPMQRILKYPLLLRDLHKYSVDPHQDREGLAVALETMQDVAKYINEVKRDNETINTILEIQRSITDINMPLNTYLTDYGKLQRDGVLRIKAHEDQNSRQRNRHVFLFDKVMLMCKPSGEEFRYKRALDLAKYKVEDRDTGDTGNWGHQFVLSDISNNHAYTCYAKTLEMKKKWISAIRLALENTIPPYSRTATHEFTLQTFSEPTTCSVCGKLLYGIFFQGYRCNRTDTNAHKECIVKRTVVEATTTTTAAQATAQAIGGGGVGVGGGVAGYIGNAPSTTTHPLATAICRARAVATYKGDPSAGLGLEPLTFVEGETIEVLSKCDSFWWQGRTAPTPPPINGGGAESPPAAAEKIGFFPAHFVKELAHGRPSVPHSPPPPPDPAAAAVIGSGGGGGGGGRLHANGGHLSPGFQSPIVKNDPLSPSQRMNILNPQQQQQQQQLQHQRQKSVDESELTNYPWFVRQMERVQAEQALKNACQGTFMIRESVRTGGFALSLVFGDDVKHIRIQVSFAEGLYFLADVKFFSSIPSLVDFYASHSLVDSFPGLDTVLKYPFRQMSRDAVPKASIKIMIYAVAMYDFKPTDANQLALRRGDRIAVVSKAGDDRGWWKGQVQQAGASKKIGYFPKKYVKELRDDSVVPFALPNLSHA